MFLTRQGGLFEKRGREKYEAGAYGPDLYNERLNNLPVRHTLSGLDSCPRAVSIPPHLSCRGCAATGKTNM